MKKHLQTILLFTFVFVSLFFIYFPNVLANNEKSTPLILNDSSEREDLYPSIDLIKDRNDEYTINDIRQDDVASQFTNINNIKQKKGFFHSPNWLRFEITNESVENHWFLEFAFPLVNELELYTIENNEVISLYKTGANEPFDQRPFNHRNFVLPIDIEQGESKVFYAYAVGSGDLHPPIIIWDQEAFMDKTQIEFLLLGIFYGISIVMILYNLFLYISLRLKSYLFYVLTITFTLLGKISINGLGYQYLWPNFPQWNIISTTIWVAIASIFILIFTRYFLDVDQYIPTFKRYYYTFIPLNMLIILTIPFSRFVALYLMIIISVATFALAIVTASICLYRGAREARFYLLGWFIFLTGVSITMLERAVVIPYSVITEYAGQTALTFEVVLLSLALADKFNIMRQEKRTAERKALESQELALQNLKQADELKDEFLAITSHELRTPLYGMIGIAESLRDGVLGPIHPKMKSQLSMIITSGERLTELVSEILDFSKLKYKSLELDKKPVNINSILQIVLAILDPLVRDKPIKLINKLNDDVPNVLADENRLQQILYNLLDNAIKYTDEGTVKITTTEQNGFLNIHITDSGPGISDEQMKTIFEPFHQGETSLSRKKSGIGIGLNVTKSLIELHDGTLNVKSTIGNGSTFSISLPIAYEMETEDVKDMLTNHNVLKEPSNILQFPQPVNKENPTILVVDDEVVNVQVLMNHLSLQGYDVLTSLRGEKVIDIVAKNDIDLIVLDIMMPGMSGYEVCQQLRKQYSLMDLPILMLTAKNQLQDKMLAFEAGANDYLVKPCDKQELLSRVKTLVDVKQLNEEIMQMNKHLEEKVQERTYELKVANEHLQDIATSRRKLLANIAHELGTPVTIIHHYIQSLQQQLIAIDNEHYMKLVTDKINVLNRLIDDLYQLSVLEAESSNISVSLKDKPLHLCVDQVIKNSRLTVIQSGRTFTSAPLPNDLDNYVCSIDEERIDQLFSNLISNAIKNTDQEKGRIRLEVTTDNDTIVIALTDNGRGINKEDLPYIFERFYKQETRSDEPAGTGLGLAIVKQIVDNHRGHITVESDVGTGTTFYVSIPIKQMKESPTVQQIANYKTTKV